MSVGVQVPRIDIHRANRKAHGELTILLRKRGHARHQVQRGWRICELLGNASILALFE